MNIARLACLLAFASLHLLSVAANRMGEWTVYNSFRNVTRVCQSPDRVYAIASSSLFHVSKTDGSIGILNKVNGLNSSSATAITYDDTHSLLVVGYADGNIDLVRDDGSVVNIDDLKEATVTASKFVNDLYACPSTGFVYLACGAGILCLNVEKAEVAETYNPSKLFSTTEVTKRVTVDDDSLFALTDNAVYGASLSDPTLVNPYNWTKFPSSRWSELSSPDLTSVIDSDGNFFIAEGKNGLAKRTPGGELLDLYQPDGPAMNSVFSLSFSNGRLYATTGHPRGLYDRGDTDVDGALMIYNGSRWLNFTEDEIYPATGKRFKTLCYVTVDPSDNTHYFVSSTRDGVYEFRADTCFARYNVIGDSCSSDSSFCVWNATASTLDVATTVSSPDDYITVNAIALDDNSCLWVGNEICPQYVKVMDAHGNWFEHSYPGMSNPDVLDKFFITSSGLKMLTSPRLPGGLLVIDDKGTPTSFSSHRYRFIASIKDQDGNALSVAPLCLTQDADGSIWMGTWEDGIYVLKNPSNIFSSSYTFFRPKINRTDGSGLADYLFAQQRITGIAIDGASRKWVATFSSGLYLLSDDGTRTLAHFTAHNSPLLDDCIYSMAYDEDSGELFIATASGLCSYHTDATKGYSKLKSSQLKIYPNPVRPDFNGVVTVNGLVDNALVKFTDTAGNLVYQTRANGGTATWNLRLANGKRAAAGVYFIMASLTPSGGETQMATGKLLLIR